MMHSVALNTTNKTLLTRKASSVPHTILAPVPCGRGNIYSSVYVNGMALLSCHVTHSCSLPLNTTQTPPYSTFVHTLASLSSSHPTHPPCFSPTLPHSLLCTHTLHSSLFTISYTLPPFPITHTLPPLPSPPLSHSLISPVTHTLPPLPSPPIPPLTVSTMTALSLHLSTTVVMVRQTTSRPRMTPRARRSFQSFKAWLGRREHRQHKLRQEDPNHHPQKKLLYQPMRLTDAS